MKFPRLLKLSALGLFCFIMATSCVSRKEMVYFHDLHPGYGEIADERSQALAIKPNDLLTITVAAEEQTAALPFNLPVIGVQQGGDQMGMSVMGRQQLQSYLVDANGNIQFPVLGEINVAGLNRQTLAKKLQQDISEYVQDPIVNVRIVNFQVSVLGEVTRPGTFDVQDEYLSLPKALGLAGDMSIYGKRDNILVMREEAGKKTYAYLDLTDPEVIQSPYYYLQQNDVVYVEPNKAQRQSASYNRNAGIYISIASVLVSVAVLLTR